jgi:hypothetical protein
MALETPKCGPGRNENSSALATGPRACAHAVKLHGTRGSRTSSAENAARAQRVRNSPGENKESFPNRPPPDGPRTPPRALPTPPAVVVHARDNGVLARGGTPCHARSPDTGATPATRTRPALPPGRLGYSTAPEDERGRTTAGTPSADRSAHDSEPGLAAAPNRNHAGPRTQGATTPDGQVPAAEPLLPAGTPCTGHLLFVSPRSSLITPPLLFHPFFTARQPPGTLFPAIPRRAVWPSGSAKMALS